MPSISFFTTTFRCLCLLICLLHLTCESLFVSAVLNCPEHCLHSGPLWRTKHNHFVFVYCSQEKRKKKRNWICAYCTICTVLIFRIEMPGFCWHWEHSVRDRCEPMRMANRNLFIRSRHSTERFLRIDKKARAWQCFMGQYRFDPSKCQRHNTNCLNDECNQSILLEEMKLIVEWTKQEAKCWMKNSLSSKKQADGKSNALRKQQQTGSVQQ